MAALSAEIYDRADDNPDDDDHTRKTVAKPVQSFGRKSHLKFCGIADCY